MHDTDVRNANLQGAVLHRIDDKGAAWTGADRQGATGTDDDLARAEDYVPKRVANARAEERLTALATRPSTK
jgi:hypothetical protein